MLSLVPLLGITAILLTAIGSYRFSAYFVNSTALAALVAGGATLSFMILFPYVIFLMGIIALVAPAVVVSKKTSLLPSVKEGAESVGEYLQAKAKPGNNVATKDSVGNLDAYNNEDDRVSCPNCSAVYEKRVPDYCTSCGSSIGGEGS